MNKNAFSKIQLSTDTEKNNKIIDRVLSVFL